MKTLILASAVLSLFCFSGASNAGNSLSRILATADVPQCCQKHESCCPGSSCCPKSEHTSHAAGSPLGR